MVLAHCPRREGSLAEELKFKETSSTTLCDGQRIGVDCALHLVLVFLEAHPRLFRSTWKFNFNERGM